MALASTTTRYVIRPAKQRKVELNIFGIKLTPELQGEPK